MSLLNKIKEDSILARKEKDSVKASLLVTLYSEALMVGKNKRNDIPSDEETLATIQKFLKNASEVREIISKRYFNELGERPGLDKIQLEINILESYLPKQLTEQELVVIIGTAIGVTGTLKGPFNVGTIMAFLKQNYTGQYDGKVASKVAQNFQKPIGK